MYSGYFVCKYCYFYLSYYDWHEMWAGRMKLNECISENDKIIKDIIE